MSRDNSHLETSLLLFLSLNSEPLSLLDSIDDMLGGPLLSLGNQSLVEDKDVLDEDFVLFGSIIEDDTLLQRARLPRQIDDELVTRMKRPIDLPDENHQPDYSTDDYGGLVEATSAVSLTSSHHPPSSPRGNHHKHAPMPDARYGSSHCGAMFSLEPPDTPRRPRSFGYARHQSLGPPATSLDISPVVYAR
ncbi:hypothetical protein C0995_006136 [Termitomyces sp. Mi166|nr:hypothetical protein C0995_006136 [Termitomyces sp. Mi166\